MSPSSLLRFTGPVLFLSPFVAVSGPVDFSRDIRPILAEHCLHCHGGDTASRRGDLRLDLREAAVSGGTSGRPAIVPGTVETGELLARVRSTDPDEVMPPPREKKPLTDAQTELLSRWIAEGAPYADHWAFTAPERRPVPADRHPVAVLVDEVLAPAGLDPSPPADPATLARRLFLDLIGLPPSPAETAAFVAAHARDADAAVADLARTLLASPRYGEKWARHWLDAARYADSNGYEKDLPRDQWAWRDWVIRALNEDLPYDRFVVEQIAGDLLPGATPDQRVATGFLRNSMTNEEGAIVPEQFRMEELFDRMDCLGKAVLGLSLQCAQCHSHKFDPISHDEYFGIFAFLNDTHEAQSWVYDGVQQEALVRLRDTVRAAEDELRRARPDWPAELAAWSAAVLAGEPAWEPLRALELGSAGGLNHPTQESDLSILTLGHPSSNGEIHATFEPRWDGVTGLRLEALTHPDLPFGGPGRSWTGLWAVSELILHVRLPDAPDWQPVPLAGAVTTADFSEPTGRLEAEWDVDFDPRRERLIGPASHLVDGQPTTAWRADRGPGRRNQESAAVIAFPSPLEYPPGTRLKVTLAQKHGGGDAGRRSGLLGCFRISLTRSPAPRAPGIDHAAVLALRTPPDLRSDGQRDAVFAAWRESLADPAAKAIRERIEAAWKTFPVARTSVLHLAARPPGNRRPTHLLERGVWDRPQHEVLPGVPAALHPLEILGPAPDRLDLARWLVDRRSPLAARVAVNRVWQVLFGEGLVETSEDFGTRAPLPEHLALLDWLAVDFMEHGWSQKHLLGVIVGGGPYRRSSVGTEAARAADPRNRLLARGPRFRLDAEVLRDNALAVSGLLHLPAPGGPSVFPPVPASVLETNYVKPAYWIPPSGPERYRRSLYLFRKRSMPDPLLGSFDSPNGDASCVRRQRSNTPVSALAALNEPVLVEAAQALALRILREGGRTAAEQAAYAYRVCLAREIRPAERDAVLALWESSLARLRTGELDAGRIAFSDFTRAGDLPPDATPNEMAAWTVVARVLLNLDEVLTKS